MIEPEFVDEERIPLLERDENINDSVYEDSQTETSFNHDDVIQQEANERNLDTEINALERGFNVKIPPEERGRFRMSSGYLQVEKSPGEYANLTKSNGEFLAESTMRNRLGASLARSLLGIETPSSSKSYSRVLLKDLDIIEMNELTPQRLEEVIDEVTRSIGTNTDLDMREFLGIDKALTRISGELANNVSKLTEIDEHLKREHTKLDEIKDDPSYSENLRDRIKKRITDLKEERATRLEITSQNRKELASQFSRIRQTVEKILDEDLSLREKLKLVFREHGLTITAVLTSIGLIISTIVTALTGGSAGGSSTPPKKPSKLKEWIKSKLKALARVLGRLAGKAAAALPGIIGSIIAGVLNFLKKVVTAAAEHVWLFLLSIATLIGYKLVDSFQKPNRKKR
ncbi:MAG: hypothetical protein AAGM46_27490 [Cyanobacteria bacterium J06582_2]